ncbi:hypothetical protein IAD21_02937 [Abditibacteriota bacterium]|nr:hypothetical protein IAD21_02937 [Abditibacteriota bacterium]
MSIFGLFLSAPRAECIPTSPGDAPLRLGSARLLATCGLSIPFALLVFVFNFHLFFEVVGWLGIVAAFAVPFVLWRRYDRIGWYERREVVTPELPYEMRELGERIVFGVELVTYSLFLRPKRTLSYAQIVKVHIDCEGDCLKGVILGLTHNHYWSVKTAPQIISDSGDGERTRTVLAILREKAPHATFSGPKWVEEGWMPRMGFTHPSSGAGGGGP